MSGWIKMGVDLPTHPKVVRIASALKADKCRVIGGLFAVWCIFDAHSQDGQLGGYTFDAMDAQIGWRGFSAAMAAVGWLAEIPNDGIEAPRFGEHNGATAKRRAVETLRRTSARAAVDKRTKTERVSAWNEDKKRTESGQVSAINADKKRTRGEERREEKKEKETKETQPAVAGSSSSPSADDDRPPLAALQHVNGQKIALPDCPHAELLALWAEVLPALPQHDPQQWRGARADHLRSRWREAAVAKHWAGQEQGIEYFRRLFGYVGQSPFLTGHVTPRDPNKRPFVVELEWLVKPDNWAKTVEGKYHAEENVA